MKKVCVLLDGSISNDSRAQRVVRVMARHAEVHVYFVPRDPGDTGAGVRAGPNVRFIPVPHAGGRKDWALRHTFFFLEFDYMADAVLASGVRYDVVNPHDLPITHAAIRVARKHGARIYYDVHDLTVETINQGFPLDPPFHKRIKYALARWVMRNSGHWWERRFTRRSDLVVTVSESLVGYLRERYGIEGGMAVPNYPEYRDVEKSDRLYGLCGIRPDRRIALYHGSLGRGRFLRRIVESARHLDPRNVLVIVGGGHLDSELKELAGDAVAQGRIHFHDFVPYDELLSLVSGASLGLNLIDPINLSKKNALPNKLTEYMAAGVAVLGSDSPENRRILSESDAGYLYPVTTPEALGARINELLDDPADLARKGANGKKAFREKYNWQASEPLFEKAFLALLGGP